MATTVPARADIPADAAAALLVQGQGLLDRTDRKPTRANLRRAITRLGYVQLDSINVVARAHDLTLRARFQDYRPEHLQRLVESRPVLFENWVHDAAVLPIEFAAPWQTRFRAYVRARRERMSARSGSRDFTRLCRKVRQRIEAEGPLSAKDFDAPRDHVPGGWWEWKPAKVALEYLWRTGALTVAKRVHFQKHYDLTERHLPALSSARPMTRRQYIDWACREALDRIGTATDRELAHYWHGMTAHEARAWGERAARRGDAVPALRHARNGSAAQKCLAVPDWRERVQNVGAPPSAVRVIAPFDPVVRERDRLSRLFDFDYTFEAFVPEAKRRDGYYVTPLWRGLQPIGRCDPKLDRATGTLHIRRLRLEPGVARSAKLPAEIEDALDGLRAWLGAERLVRHE